MPSTATLRRRARRAEAEAGREARRANRGLRHVVLNEWVTSAARLGYIVRGGLYAVMGGLALALALGFRVSTSDQRGVISLLGTSPLALVVVGLAVVALAAYASWGFARALYDPLGRGHDAAGIAARLGFAWSGLNYAALCVFGTAFLTGQSRHADDRSIPHLIDHVLSLPAGRVAVIVAGVIGLVGGLGQFVDAYRAGFKGDVKRGRMTRAERAAADTLGRAGMVARGVIFTLLAWFILAAGLANDSARAEGMGATFRSVEAAPLGRTLLAAIALGFIALGFHSVMNAVWVRTPRD